MDQLEQAQFEMEALLLAVIQIVEGAQHDLQIARQLFFGKQQRRARGAGALVGGDLQQLSLLAAQLGHERIAQVAHHLPRQRRRAVAGVQQHVQLLHQLGALALGHGFQQPLEDGVGHRSPSARESARR